MIALPGCVLATKQYETAKSILRILASSRAAGSLNPDCASNERCLACASRRISALLAASGGRRPGHAAVRYGTREECLDGCLYGGEPLGSALHPAGDPCVSIFSKGRWEDKKTDSPSEDNFSDRRCTRLKRWLGVFAAISSPWSLRVTEKAAEVDGLAKAPRNKGFRPPGTCVSADFGPAMKEVAR